METGVLRSDTVNNRLLQDKGNRIQVIDTDAMFKAIFAKETTSDLTKKYFCYKLMGSDFFINFSLTILNTCYRLLGVRLTNFFINKTSMR